MSWIWCRDRKTLANWKSFIYRRCLCTFPCEQMWCGRGNIFYWHTLLVGCPHSLLWHQRPLPMYRVSAVYLLFWC